MREKLKKIILVKKVYREFLLVKNLVISLGKRLFMFLFNRQDYLLLSSLKCKVNKIHDDKLNLTNVEQVHIGKNIIGYPALSYILKDGKPIGWSQSNLEKNGKSLPFLQVNTDVDENIPAIFSELKPEIVVDFGTASGGSAVFFYDLIKKYAEPAIFSIDISDKDVLSSKDFHDNNHTWDKIKFCFGKSSLDCKEEVSSFIGKRTDTQRVLLSFDDNHTYEHTFSELSLYAPMLKTGDIILMQDTWDQSLYGHETSPMLAVEKFISQNDNWEIATDFLKKVKLPCNFIYGVIIKK